MQNGTVDLMRNRSIVILLAATAALSGWGQSPSQSSTQNHFVVTSHQVALTLSDRGMPVSDDHVSLLANVVATDPHPVLDVLSVKPWGTESTGTQAESRSLIELACHVPGGCLPFYAVVTGSRSPARASGAPVSSPIAASARRATFDAIMRAGTHAILIMDDKRSQVQLTVISLENGNAGDKIRVSSPDHKQVYTAEVVNASLLKRSY
jgi:hypothetical protein